MFSTSGYKIKIIKGNLGLVFQCHSHKYHPMSKDKINWSDYDYNNTTVMCIQQWKLGSKQSMNEICLHDYVLCKAHFNFGILVYLGEVTSSSRKGHHNYLVLNLPLIHNILKPKYWHYWGKLDYISV